MGNNKTQKNKINEADYIDIIAYIKIFLRLSSRYLLLILPLILCLIAGMYLLTHALVKEQYTAKASFVVGVPLAEDFSYNYTLPNVNEEYVVQMSDAFREVINSEYMHFLLKEESGKDIPGEINWDNAVGTNMGGITVVSDSMKNATQLREATIACLPKALSTTLGDIEIKVKERVEQKEVLHEELQSPVIWVGIGVVGAVFAYLGLIFIMTLFYHNIDTVKDMRKITNLPCLGTLPKLRKRSSSNDEYNRSFSDFRNQLIKDIEQQQIKTLLFTGENKKRGQKEIIDKLNHDWASQGKKVVCFDMDSFKAPETMVETQEEMNLYITRVLKDADLLIINGPGYEQTIELLTLADCVDGIVYVVKAGRNRMENLKEAICSLGFSQAELLGYVFIN